MIAVIEADRTEIHEKPTRDRLGAVGAGVVRHVLGPQVLSVESLIRRRAEIDQVPSDLGSRDEKPSASLDQVGHEGLLLARQGFVEGGLLPDDTVTSLERLPGWPARPGEPG